MSNQNINNEELYEKLAGLIDTANDTLAVISGNAEFALLDIPGEEFEPLKRQLQVITVLSEEIGSINDTMMELLQS